jgi:hypothetical protein
MHDAPKGKNSLWKHEVQVGFFEEFPLRCVASASPSALEIPKAASLTRHQRRSYHLLVDFVVVVFS